MIYDTDLRFNNFHLINRTVGKWSTDWSQFPGIPIAFNFEKEWLYVGNDRQQWLQDKWHYSIWISIAYVISIFSLKSYMKDRKPFDLRRPLAVWSTALSIFSIIGTIRCFPEFIHILTKKGFVESFCNSSYFEDVRLSTWYWFFVMSKTLEMGDTLFIVLRKQKLIALHWWHHALTLIYCWYVFSDVPGTARWMVNMNFAVHSLMYGYYGLKALRIPMPRVIAIFITTLQISQMVFGISIKIIAYQRKVSNLPCDLSRPVASTGLAIYGLFFLFFVNFFISNYLCHLTVTRRKSISKGSVTIKANDCNNNAKQKIN